jgi:CBS domain-containing protein
MRARDAIRKPPVTIRPDATIAEAAALLDRAAVGALVVVDHDDPVGIVTDRDLALRAVGRRIPADSRVDAVMSIGLITLSADSDVREAIAVFERHAIRRLPLLEAGRMVGMLTIDDLVIDWVNDLATMVRPVVGQVVFGAPEPSIPVPAPMD